MRWRLDAVWRGRSSLPPLSTARSVARSWVQLLAPIHTPLELFLLFSHPRDERRGVCGRLRLFVISVGALFCLVEHQEQVYQSCCGFLLGLQILLLLMIAKYFHREGQLDISHI